MLAQTWNVATEAPRDDRLEWDVKRAEDEYNSMQTAVTLENQARLGLFTVAVPLF